MTTTENHYWCRVECDARLLPRKLERRKTTSYAVSGAGEQRSEDGTTLRLVVLVGMLQAPSRELALSQILHDCPGGVITFCREDRPYTLRGSRFEHLPVYRTRAKLADAQALALAELHMAQIEACRLAHKAWMRRNEQRGRTDDAAARLLPPWPRVTPAYP